MATEVELDVACPSCGAGRALLESADIGWVTLTCSECATALDPRTPVHVKPPRRTVDTPTGDLL